MNKIFAGGTYLQVLATWFFLSSRLNVLNGIYGVESKAYIFIHFKKYFNIALFAMFLFYACMYKLMCVCTCTCMHVQVHVSEYTCVCVDLRVDMCLYVCIFLNVHISVCLFHKLLPANSVLPAMYKWEAFYKYFTSASTFFHSIFDIIILTNYDALLQFSFYASLINVFHQCLDTTLFIFFTFCFGNKLLDRLKN